MRSRRPTEAPIIAATSAGGTAPSSRRNRALWYSALRPTLARCCASRAPAPRSLSSPSSVSICWSFLRTFRASRSDSSRSPTERPKSEKVGSRAPLRLSRRLLGGDTGQFGPPCAEPGAVARSKNPPHPQLRCGGRERGRAPPPSGTRGAMLAPAVGSGKGSATRELHAIRSRSSMHSALTAPRHELSAAMSRSRFPRAMRWQWPCSSAACRSPATSESTRALRASATCSMSARCARACRLGTPTLLPVPPPSPAPEGGGGSGGW